MMRNINDACVEEHDRSVYRRLVSFLMMQGQCLSQIEWMQVRNGVVELWGKFASPLRREVFVQCCQRVAGVLSVRDMTSVRTR